MKFINKIKEIVKKIIIGQTNKLLAIDWNNEQEKIVIPSQPSSTIINSFFQVFRSVSDVLIEKDLIYLFEEIIVLTNDFLLNKIKSDLIIRNDLGYKLLCKEIDYLGDNFEDIFAQKIDLDYKLISNSLKEIEKIKYNLILNDM